MYARAADQSDYLDHEKEWANEIDPLIVGKRHISASSTDVQ